MALGEEMGVFNFHKWLPCMCYITSFDKYFCSTDQNTFFIYLKMSFAGNYKEEQLQRRKAFCPTESIVFTFLKISHVNSIMLILKGPEICA